MLKLQYFGHLMQRANLLEKTLMLREIEGKRRSGWQRMRWLDSITNSMHMNVSKLCEIVKVREAWCAAIKGSQRVRHDRATEQQYSSGEQSWRAAWGGGSGQWSRALGLGAVSDMFLNPSEPQVPHLKRKDSNTSQLTGLSWSSNGRKSPEYTVCISLMPTF